MIDRRASILMVGACLLGGAIGGYYFGLASGRSASRSFEAAQDILVPVDDIRRDRIRRESIRAMLAEVTEAQANAYAISKTFLEAPESLFDREAYVLETYSQTSCPYSPDGCVMEERWIGVARHRTSPIGEVCAVALNTEPAHVAGIPLKREGRIRCSWDLATRINRVLW
jgi:hypothetical protein